MNAALHGGAEPSERGLRGQRGMCYTVYNRKIRASQGFDRGLAAGEAIRRLMRQIANLNINAEDNLAYAA